MSEQQSSITAHFKQTFFFTEIKLSCICIFNERLFIQTSPFRGSSCSGNIPKYDILYISHITWI